MKSIADFKNISHAQAYEHLTEFMLVVCKELDVTPPTLIVGISLIGSFYDHQKELLLLCPLQLDFLKFHPFVAIAHELKHREQSVKGALQYDFVKMERIWGEQRFTIAQSQLTPHRELPWEADAIKYEDEVAKQLGLLVIRGEMDMITVKTA